MIEIIEDIFLLLYVTLLMLITFLSILLEYLHFIYTVHSLGGRPVVNKC